MTKNAKMNMYLEMVPSYRNTPPPRWQPTQPAIPEVLVLMMRYARQPLPLPIGASAKATLGMSK